MDLSYIWVDVWDNTLSDLILIVGQYDLHFIIWWFSLIFLLLFYRFASYFGYCFFFADTMCDLMLVKGQRDLYKF